MNRNTLTTAVIAGIAGVAGIANMASAVNLNPDGLGQVLLYPYYTVNSDQQTLLSVVNTTSVGKVVKVRFLEGYNSREVLDFNLYLSHFDVWTADVFSLGDLPGGTGAQTTLGGIFTTDNSCTDPAFSADGTSFIDASGHSQAYVAFRNFYYTGANSDTGPTADSRTREGHFEMISMGDVIPGSVLDTDITHIAGVPPGCSSAGADTPGHIVAPLSGLFGAASVVHVSQGTFYAYNADTLDGFTLTTLYSPSGFTNPTLGYVNDIGAPATVTSHVFANGTVLNSPYAATTPALAIDAVTSIFDAENIYNEYVSVANGSEGTSWVVNFPTKRFYVDGATFSLATVVPPFEHLFGAVEPGNGLGLSCTVVGISIFDREEGSTTPSGCGFSPCPPGQPPSSICHETNVISFLSTGQPEILGSNLASNIHPIATGGWVNLDLNSAAAAKPHTMRAATNGNVFHGLPVTGFEAANYTNGSVSLSGGGTALANYSGVYRHRLSRDCTNVAGVCS